MATSQNGYEIIKAAENRSPFPNTNVVPLPGLKDGDTAFLLLLLGQQFNERVEQLINPGCWGWANKKIQGSKTYSNHASGTAIDLNAPQHPQFKKGTFTPNQVKAIREILAMFKGVIRWGGDYEASRVDEMHFEIVGTPAQVHEVALSLMGGKGSGDGQAQQQRHYETVKVGTTWNVRNAPDKNGSVLGQIKGGDVYDTIVQANGWRQIWFKNQTGFVSGDGFGVAAPQPVRVIAVINGGTWNVRNKPSNFGKVVSQVKGGQQFTHVLKDGWLVVPGGFVGPKGYKRV